ncbi:MAG: thioredoxin family protein [bacterium]
MATETLKLGSSIPRFELIGINNKTYTENSFENKKGLVIVFSCNHCPYVQAYEKRLVGLQDKYKNDIQILAINANDEKKYPEDSFEQMKLRAKKMGFNFPYLHDITQEVAKSFDATHTPEIFLFNKSKKLVFHGKIDDNWQDETMVKNRYLENAINELIDEQEISVPETFTIGCTIKWK